LNKKRTGEPALKNFLSKFITEIAGLSDDDLISAIKLENEMANAIRS
jgi:hypothetical protein